MVIKNNLLSKIYFLKQSSYFYFYRFACLLKNQPVLNGKGVMFVFI